MDLKASDKSVFETPANRSTSRRARLCSIFTRFVGISTSSIHSADSAVSSKPQVANNSNNDSPRVVVLLGECYMGISKNVCHFTKFD